jgi:hypothetical protein
MFIVPLYNVHSLCTLQILYSALECLLYFSYFHCSRSKTQSRYTVWQCPLSSKHSIMMVKLTQPGEGEGGLQTLPFSLYLPSQAKLLCALQLRGQIYYPCFSSTLYVLCGPRHGYCFFRGLFYFYPAVISV